MKKITLLLFLLIFNFSFSQKKELRKAQKLYEAGDIDRILMAMRIVVANVGMVYLNDNPGATNAQVRYVIFMLSNHTYSCK